MGNFDLILLCFSINTKIPFSIKNLATLKHAKRNRCDFNL
jgi:hypothetical protein